MVLSRDDQRLKLVRFETEHLQRAIPMKVATRNHYGNYNKNKLYGINYNIIK